MVTGLTLWKAHFFGTDIKLATHTVSIPLTLLPNRVLAGVGPSFHRPCASRKTDPSALQGVDPNTLSQSWPHLALCQLPI